MRDPDYAQDHRARTHAVGKAAKPARPGGGGTSATGGKGTATHKHHRHSHHKHRLKKPRRWTPDGEVALCSARALAESLRLALGRPVSDEDVLALYWLTASAADAGATILATLEAACLPRPATGHALPFPPFLFTGPFAEPVHAGEGSAVILGLDLPGGEPHAVTVGPDGTWWSWGRPFDPAGWPGLAVEEAWAVTWS